MTIGWALLIIAAVYLIERHKLWRRTFQIAGVLLVLAALGVAGIILNDRHNAAKAAKHEAEITECVARVDKAETQHLEAQGWTDVKTTSEGMDAIRKVCAANPKTEAEHGPWEEYRHNADRKQHAAETAQTKKVQFDPTHRFKPEDIDAIFEPIEPPPAGFVPEPPVVQIDCADWMKKDTNGKCWGVPIPRARVRELVDCFDKKTGKLVPDVSAASGFSQIGCEPNYIQKPAGQCKRLVSDWFAAHAPGAPDCYLPPAR